MSKRARGSENTLKRHCQFHSRDFKTVFLLVEARSRSISGHQPGSGEFYGSRKQHQTRI